MALVLKDRVKETTTTTGTSSFSLAGAVTGYDSFGQIGTGNTTYYACYLDGGTEWEVGIGTYTAPSTLSRDTILASSAAGAKVSFSAGQKTIWCDYPAGKAVYTDATGSISQPIVNISGITGSISSPDYIQFDTTYTTPLGVGQLGWDGNDTLGLGMSGGNIVQEIGLQTYIYGKASSAITKGQLIQKTGSNGSSGVITFAPTTANMTDSGAIIGIAAESIALNGFGYIISTGNLRGFNTTGSSSGETWADGDTLYYNPSGNGLMTKVKPSAPNLKVEVAIVVNAGSGGSGSVAVEIIHGSVLGGTDSNVQITSPTGGQTLIYDQTDGYWKNSTLTDGTAINITEGASGTITITNTGVTALSAGTGVSVSSSTGSVTVTNTAPDQTVSLAAGTGISTTGTYPSFTVTNTAPDQTVSLSAGTGISTSGTYPSFTVTNTAPDQVVSLSNGTGISVSGTYPSFTITNTSPSSGGTVTSVGTGTGLTGGPITGTGTISLANTSVTAGSYTNSTITVDAQGRLTAASSGTAPVTSVSGTAPIASSGGTTPTISIPQASGTADGYLSSTDWTTFNNKQASGTYVTSVSATSPVTSTGGTTPTIAMPAANGTTNGYLTSTDWTTFNGKGNGTVTSVATGTGLTGGPITGTGTISLANTSVTAGSYTTANITVDAQGRITAASNGSGGGGGLTLQSVQTTGFTAVSGNSYPCNTTSAAFTVTLPASPAAGAIVQLFDYAGTFDTNNLTVNPNGSKISGSTSNATIVRERESITYTYVDSTQGWCTTNGVVPRGPYTVTYLIVGGGASGAKGTPGVCFGAGGGGGGLQSSTTTVNPGQLYTITVGAGGAGSATIGTSVDGNDSSAFSVTAGKGLKGNATSGSGSGGSSGTPQSNAGFGTGINPSGGGGGAGAAATNANGGAGASNSTSGSSQFYGGGGGGGGDNTIGSGGSGGGGTGAKSGGTPTSGTANTGGGGGSMRGDDAPAAGNGGSGIVIISYPGSQVASGGTVTSVGGNTIHTFTSSGTFQA